MTEGDQEIGDDNEPEDPVEQRPELAGNEIGGLDADHEAQESENDRPGRPAASSSCPALPRAGDGQQGHREPRGDRGNPLGHARSSERQAGVLGVSGLSPARRAGRGETVRSRAIRKAARVVPPARTARLGARAMATSARIVTGGPLRSGGWPDPVPIDLSGATRRVA
jgi:hypothetical protein